MASECICVTRGGPEGCGLCNETGSRVQIASTDSPAEGGGWHREDSSGCTLLYTLRDTGKYRRGEAVQENDIMVRIDRCHRSDTPVEPIIQRVMSALSRPAPIEPVVREKVEAEIKQAFYDFDECRAAGSQIIINTAGRILALLSSNTGEG